MWNSVVCEDSMEGLTGLSFPLPGQIQTVPRAELYAIKYLVCNCYCGIIDIASDSLTNVETYNDRDKSKMQKSLNADLWYKINKHCVEFGVKLLLRWVKGHLDTKTTEHVFTDHDFALNYHADKFAEVTNAEAQVSAHEAASVFHSIARVRKIQARLVAILCSDTLDKVEQQYREPNQPKGVPTHDAQINSAHVICEQDTQLKCIVCLSTCSKSKGLRAWLDSCCTPVEQDEQKAPVLLWPWEPVRIGTQVVHSSHSMYAYRGVRFCAVCGGYGVHRTTLLIAKCQRGTGNAARAAVIRKMFAKQLPININDWPAIFQPVALDDSQISNEDKLCINRVRQEIKNHPSNTRHSVVHVDDSTGESSDVDIPAEPVVRRPMNFDADEDDFPMEQSNSESD